MPYTLVLVGIIFYTIIYFLILRKITSVTFFSTFEHEATHAIFSILTMNRVTKFRAGLRDGGHIEYEGKGNWLVALSPYFFPTLSVLYILSIMTFNNIRPTGIWLNVIYGVTIAYQFISTYEETHPQQTDFKAAGTLFSIVTLAPLNLLFVIILLSAVPSNGITVSDGLYLYLEEVKYGASYLTNHVQQYLAEYLPQLRL